MPKKIKDVSKRILDAAATIYHEEGFANISMRRVAQVSGIAVGTVYNRFADKEDLVAQVLAGDIEQLKGSMMEAVFGKQPDEGLYAVILSFIDRMMTESNNIIKYVMDIQSQEEFVARILRGACGQLRDLVQELICRVCGQRGLILAAEQGVFIAEMCLSMMQSAAQYGCGSAAARADTVFGMLIAYAGQGAQQAEGELSQPAEIAVV